MKEATWTSLEIVKLIVAGLTPVLVVLAGFWLNRRLKSLEQAQWAQQKVIERRIQAYDELAKPLNQLFCFFCYVGSWKETDPPDVVSLKRGLDQTAHISAPLFDQDLLRLYNGLLDRCFMTFGGWGEDAKLRTHPDRRQEFLGEDWDSEWNACFSERAKASAPSEIRDAYAELMAYLGRAIGAREVNEHLLGSGRVPSNYDRSVVEVVSRTAPDEETTRDGGA
jgi:hypothetical protein